MVTVGVTAVVRRQDMKGRYNNNDSDFLARLENDCRNQLFGIGIYGFSKFFCLIGERQHSECAFPLLREEVNGQWDRPNQGRNMMADDNDKMFSSHV